jgi:hypothetical protein
MVREKIQNAPNFLDVGLGVGLQGMNHIRKLHPITHKEDWEVVAHHIKVPLFSNTDSQSM